MIDGAYNLQSLLIFNRMDFQLMADPLYAVLYVQTGRFEFIFFIADREGNILQDVIDEPTGMSVNNCFYGAASG